MFAIKSNHHASLSPLLSISHHPPKQGGSREYTQVFMVLQRGQNTHSGIDCDLSLFLNTGTPPIMSTCLFMETLIMVVIFTGRAKRKGKGTRFFSWCSIITLVLHYLHSTSSFDTQDDGENALIRMSVHGHLSLDMKVLCT